jgi:hypothetical protein
MLISRSSYNFGEKKNSSHIKRKGHPSLSPSIYIYIYIKVKMHKKKTFKKLYRGYLLMAQLMHK